MVGPDAEDLFGDEVIVVDHAEEIVLAENIDDSLVDDHDFVGDQFGARARDHHRKFLHLQTLEVNNRKGVLLSPPVDFFVVQSRDHPPASQMRQCWLF